MISKMIIASNQLGCSEEIITIAAILSIQVKKKSPITHDNEVNTLFPFTRMKIEKFFSWLEICIVNVFFSLSGFLLEDKRSWMKLSWDLLQLRFLIWFLKFNLSYIFQIWNHHFYYMKKLISSFSENTLFHRLYLPYLFSLLCRVTMWHTWMYIKDFFSPVNHHNGVIRIL